MSPGTGSPAVTSAGTPDRTVPALVLTIGGLVLFNVARNRVVPDGAQLGANVAAAGAVAMIAWWAGMGADELGLRRDRIGAGVRAGAGVLVVVVAALVVVALVPAMRPALDDSRVDVGPGSLAFEVGVSIPFGTVLLEELAFRGSLLGLFARRTSTRRAAASSSVLFGLWHVLPTLSATDANDALGDLATGGPGLALVLVGTVLATGAAGMVLCWLRLRAGSLVAPVVAHLAVNGVTFTVAWIVAR